MRRATRSLPSRRLRRLCRRVRARFSTTRPLAFPLVRPRLASSSARWRGHRSAVTRSSCPAQSSTVAAARTDCESITAAACGSGLIATRPFRFGHSASLAWRVLQGRMTCVGGWPRAVASLGGLNGWPAVPVDRTRSAHGIMRMLANWGGRAGGSAPERKSLNRRGARQTRGRPEEALRQR